MLNDKKKQAVLIQHKREVIWQIWVPVGFGAAAILVLGILAAFSLQTGTDSAARWGHVATVWLLLPVFLIGLFTFIILAGAIFLVINAMGAVHDYAPLVQYYFQTIAFRISGMANRTVQPVIQSQSNNFALRRFWVTVRLMLLGGNKD